MNQNLRTEDAEDDNNIIIDDINDFLSDEGIDLNNPSKGKKTIGFVQWDNGIVAMALLPEYQ